MIKLKKIIFLILGIGVSYSVNATVNLFPIKIKLKNSKEKIVQIMKIKLSKINRIYLKQNILSISLHSTMRNILALNNEKKKVVLGMNQVPVLDQGCWGTCATFAATEAIDALLSLKNDQGVSQLCNLELGRTLNNPNPDGGWTGSSGDLVLTQISQYGFLNKEYQHKNGCGGLKNYPVYDNLKNGDAMSFMIFSQHAQKTFTTYDWKPIISINEEVIPVTNALAFNALSQVKKSLSNEHRIVFGTLMIPFVGTAGAVGNYKNIKNDTWVLTEEIADKIDSSIIGGHEMVITGFDDNACATYQDKNHETQKQCGILYLRNSWSKDAGDHGEFYMTYDYFKAMAIEAYEIGKNVK